MHYSGEYTTTSFEAMFAALRRSVLLLGIALVAPRIVSAQAQAPSMPRAWEPPGFDFTPDGVWRVRARAVFAARLAALRRGDLFSLNAPLRRAANLVQGGGTMSSTMAVSGVLREPIFLVRFKNTDTTTLRAPSLYQSDLLDPVPPAGQPYTIRTFYEQMSGGLISIQGSVVGWLPLDSNDSYYEAGCNGLCGNSKIDSLMREAVTHADSTVDFGQFDNDGPDGIPNSGDDDGVVDLAVFVQPELDGACGGNPDLWSHRYSYSGWTGHTLATKDTVRDRNGNPKLVNGQVQFIQINNYTIQSGVGGATACDALNIMAIGTTAHETGHGFGLPDFYDTQPGDADNSEGIGHWGLMSSGNYALPYSPAYMEGYSRMLLGWVTVRDITPGTWSLGSYSVADTIFRVTPPTGINNRNEYYLLENRQGTLSDSALIRIKGPGLLIFHVDPVQYAAGLGSNTVNTGLIHALAIEQADGLNNLGSSLRGSQCPSNPLCANRGDAGDPYPGSTGNPVFGFGANPSATLNSGTNSGVVIDSIKQLAQGGPMSFRLHYAFPLVFSASGIGTVAASGNAPSGTTYAPGDSVTLTASPSGNQVFVNWTGDTTSTSTTLKLHMTRGWSVVANFFTAPQGLVTDSIVTQLLGLHTTLNATQLQYLDLLGNRNGRLDLGDLVAFLDKTGGSVSAAVMRQLIAKAKR